MKIFVAAIEKKKGGSLVVLIDEDTLEYMKQHDARVIYAEEVGEDDNYIFEVEAEVKG